MFDPLVAGPVRTDQNQSRTGRFQLTENLDSAFVDLRGNATDPNFLNTVQLAIGMSPPSSPNTYHHKDGRGLFWLGPDQWLVVMPYTQLQQSLSDLNAARQDTIMAFTDVSGGYTLLVAQGEQVDAFVRSGTGYDVAQLKTGVCTQTLLANAQVTMWKPSTTEYRFLVRRSYANYLYRWLMAANTSLVENTND